MGDSRRENALFSVKWGILKEKTRDIRVKWKVSEERTRVFWVKCVTSEEKTRDFRLNGGFSKRKGVIFT